MWGIFLGFVGFGGFCWLWGGFFGFWGFFLCGLFLVFFFFFKGSLIQNDFHAGTEMVFKTLGWVCISERTTDSHG